MSAKKSARKKGKSKSKSSRLKRQAVHTVAPPPDMASLETAVKNNPADAALSIALAEQYYKSNQELKVLDLLGKIDAHSINLNTPQKFRFLTLLALGQAFSGELTETEETCAIGLKEFPEALDFYYVLSYVKMSLREYQAAIECGRKYLELLKVKPILDGLPLPLCGTKAHLSQLQNILGNAYREQRQIEPAISLYESAIETDPNNHLPYLNLVSTYIHTGQREKARTIIEKGLIKCREVQDLRILQRSLENNRTISACLIVKNEEKLLPGCLDSIRSWVDEIIIVDTGSTDGTIKIAESYGAKIFHQEWEGDFSKHRNYSLEQASSDWLFVIDADERFCEEDVPRLRELINSDRHSIISINVFNVYGQNEETKTFLPSVRLFKRELNLRYEGIVHNRLNFAADAPIVRANVKIKHLGYDLPPEQMKQKFERSKALLEKQIHDNPKDAFALFNLAQLLRGVGRNNPAQLSDEIIQYASGAVELTSPNELLTRNIHLMALDQLAWAHFYKKDYQQAKSFAEQAIRLKKDYLDPILLLGHVYTQLQDFQKARDAYLRYIEVQQHYDPTAEKDNIILVNPDSRATAYYGLGMLHEIQNQSTEALKYYEKTAEINHDYLGVQTRIAALNKKQTNQTSGLTAGESLLNEGRTEEADRVFQALIKSTAEKSGITDEVAQTYFAKGFYREASKYFWQLLNLNPTDPKVLNDLANCHFKLKEYEKALEYYETAAELPDAPAILFRNLGVTCSILKQFGSAIIAFRKYTSVNPNDSEIFSIMADLYSRTGDFAAALPLYEQSLRANPSDYNAVFNLSECYLNLGHEESAKVGYHRVLELKPDHEPSQKRISQLQAVTTET